jgi:dihydrolipoamide dehydrogenase
VRRLDFKQCIIAAGSESVRLPPFPDDPRIIDPTGALELPEEGKRLLVGGGGIIGLEMACVYDALRSTVTVVELSDGLVPGTGRDLVRPLQKRIEQHYARIMLGTRVAKLKPHPDELRATFVGTDVPAPQDFDRVLVAVGRSANGNAIDAAAAGVQVDRRDIIGIDREMRTNVAHIFAIGDIAGAPMLAHKATHEVKVAAEAAAAHKSSFDARSFRRWPTPIPRSPGSSSPKPRQSARNRLWQRHVPEGGQRSLVINRHEGFTKLLFDKQPRRAIGAGIVGTKAGDLIAEVGLAIELSGRADIGVSKG